MILSPTQIQRTVCPRNLNLNGSRLLGQTICDGNIGIPVNQDVRISADGGGEVGVEGHVQRIVVIVRFVEHSYPMFHSVTILLIHY